MRRTRLILVLTGILCFTLLSGCAEDQIKQLKAQNRIQQERIVDLESQISSLELQLGQLEKQKERLEGLTSADSQAYAAQLAALETDIAKKKALIQKLQAQLLRSGAALPMELSVKLQDFAAKTPGVEFDPETGMLKFSSDLLFDLGSDKVSAAATDSVKSLSAIIQSDEAKDFDVVIAGHTDDVPIKKPSTKEKHPTNWHLSAHRAISVLDMLVANGVEPTRVSIQGFGQYHPIAENKPGSKGNDLNRRVEIYLVPASES